jgi:hypothetical protein
MGVRIRHTDDIDRWARYDHQSRTITAWASLGAVQWRCAVAHELGHAHHGHEHGHPKQEREADAYAVDLLITPGEWQLATLLHCSPVAVADELGVTPRMVKVAAELYRDTASAAARSSS